MQIIAPVGPPTLPGATKIAAPVSLAGAAFAAVLAEAASPDAERKSEAQAVPTNEDEDESPATGTEISTDETPDSPTTSPPVMQVATEVPRQPVTLDDANNDLRQTEITAWAPSETKVANLETHLQPKDTALPPTEIPAGPPQQNHPGGGTVYTMAPLPTAGSNGPQSPDSSSSDIERGQIMLPPTPRPAGGAFQSLPLMPSAGSATAEPQPTHADPEIQPKSAGWAILASQTEMRQATQTSPMPSAATGSSLVMPDADSQGASTRHLAMPDDGAPQLTPDQKTGINAAAALPPSPPQAAATLSASPAPHPAPMHSTEPDAGQRIEPPPHSFPAEGKADARVSTGNPPVAPGFSHMASETRTRPLQATDTGAGLSQTDGRSVAPSTGTPKLDMVPAVGGNATEGNPAVTTALADQSAPAVTSELTDFAPGGDTTIGTVRHTAATVSDPLHTTPARAAEPHRQIADAIVRTRDGMIEVLLDPIELGRVTVLLGSETHAGRLGLLVERPETLDLLRRHSDDLIRDLRDNGMPDARMDFMRQDSSGRQNRGQNIVGQPGTARAPAPEVTAPPQIAAAAPASSGRLDIRL